MKKMCSLSRFVVFIALLSASTALRAEDASTPSQNTVAAQNSANAAPAPAASAGAPELPPPPPAAAPTAVVVAPTATDALPASIEPRPEYGQFARAINFPSDINLANVPNLLVQAATGRGWSVLSQSNGKLIITNQKGKWNCQLTLLWSPTKLAIYSNSTKGDQQVVPKSWVNNLSGDIISSFRPTYRVAKKGK